MIDSIEPMSAQIDQQRLALELVESARSEGVELVGPDGVLTGLTTVEPGGHAGVAEVVDTLGQRRGVSGWAECCFTRLVHSPIGDRGQLATADATEQLAAQSGRELISGAHLFRGVPLGDVDQPLQLIAQLPRGAPLSRARCAARGVGLPPCRGRRTIQQHRHH